MSAKNRKQASGFSLIELSIVLVIVGLLIGTMINGFVTYRQNALLRLAQDDLKLIHDALIGFAIQNGRLPCPDDDGPGVPTDGEEDITVVAGFNTCTQRAGFLPFRNLGLARARRDPWGAPYLYSVDLLLADNINTFNYDPPAPQPPTCGPASDGNTSFGICAIGDIEIKDTGLQGGPGVCPAPCRDIADNVAAVFWSIGEGGFNNLSNHEIENIPNWFPPGWPGDDQIYVSRQYSNDGVNRFDDQIMWLPSSILINRMVQAGRLP